MLLYQIPARICVESFTVFHPPVFPTGNPTLLALGWGVIATWWLGAFLGVVLAISARIGHRRKVTAGELARPILRLLAVMALSALLFGTTGYALTGRVMIAPPPWLPVSLPQRS